MVHLEILGVSSKFQFHEKNDVKLLLHRTKHDVLFECYLMCFNCCWWLWAISSWSLFFFGGGIVKWKTEQNKATCKAYQYMTREAKGHRIAKRIGEKGPRMQFSNAIHLRMMHVFLSFRCHKVCERVNVFEKRGWTQWPHCRATDYPTKMPQNMNF